MNTATLTTCDFLRENTSYALYTAYKSETISLLGVNHLIRSFRWKKCMLLSTSTSTTAAHFVGQTVDLYTIVQQLLTFHFKRMSNNKPYVFFHIDASWCFRKPSGNSFLCLLFICIMTWHKKKTGPVFTHNSFNLG